MCSSDLTGLPLVFLNSPPLSKGRGRACHEEAELALGLSLGDAINHELGVDVPRGAIVLLIDKAAKSEPASASALPCFTLLAEALEVGIRHSSTRLQVSLHVWAYLSLTEAMTGSDRRLSALRDTALEQLWGYPQRRAIISFETYLTLLDPEFALPPLEPGLAGKLESCADMAEWLERIQAAFEHRSQCDLARP